VREGDVVVLRRDDVYEARAGSGLEVGAGMVARHRVAVHGPEWSWMEQIAPEFPMEGRTLQSLVDWTARETGWSIRFARTSDSARAEQVILHGSGMGLAPSQVLEVALPACGLTFRRQDGTVWIEPARATR
jgi:hypothetical protein